MLGGANRCQGVIGRRQGHQQVFGGASAVVGGVGKCETSLARNGSVRLTLLAALIFNFFLVSGQFDEVRHSHKCQILLSECELKGVKSEAFNAECSFEASLGLDNMSGLPQSATIGFFSKGP